MKILMTSSENNKIIAFANNLIWYHTVLIGKNLFYKLHAFIFDSSFNATFFYFKRLVFNLYTNLTTKLKNTIDQRYQRRQDFVYIIKNTQDTFMIDDVARISSKFLIIPNLKVKLTRSNFRKSSFKYVVFNNHVNLNTIPSYLFSESELKLFIVPHNVKSINQHAFSYSKLVSIQLNDNLIRIANNAFYNCALESITFPASLKYIDENAFTQCYKLHSVNFENAINLTEIKHQAFYATSISKLILPPNLKYIGNSAFYKCTILEEVTLPDSIAYIDDNAFKYTSIKTISIGKNTKYSPDAFMDYVKIVRRS